MESALNKIFDPLEINCFYYTEECESEPDIMLNYSPPFYLDDKCNEIFFGVTIQKNNIDYPLTCTSEYCREKFIINIYGG